MKQKINKFLTNMYNKSGVLRRTFDIGVVVGLVLGGVLWLALQFVIIIAFSILFFIEALLAIPYCFVWFLFGKSWWGNIMVYVDSKLKLSKYLID